MRSNHLKNALTVPQFDFLKGERREMRGEREEEGKRRANTRRERRRRETEEEERSHQEPRGKIRIGEEGVLTSFPFLRAINRKFCGPPLSKPRELSLLAQNVKDSWLSEFGSPSPAFDTWLGMEETKMFRDFAVLQEKIFLIWIPIRRIFAFQFIQSLDI